MATETTILTRIQSKHDTLANWLAVEATFKPLAGEIIVYEIPSGDTTITNPPATLIKVGDGVNYLKDLKYLAARAADVASFLKTDATGATWTQAKFEAWIKGLVTIDDVDTSAFALDTDLQQVISDLSAEVARAKAAEAQALADAKSYTDTKVNEAYTYVDGAIHEHDNKAELDKIASGDKAKWDAMEQNAKDYTDDQIERLDDALTGTSESISAEKTRAEAAEAALGSRLSTIEGDYLKAADKDALQEQITANENAIELLTNGVDADTVDGVNDLIAYVNEHGTEVTTMNNNIKANATAISTEKTRATAAEDALDTRLSAVEGKVDSGGSVDTAIAVALSNAKAYTDAEVKELADGAVATNASNIAALEALVGGTSVSERFSDVATHISGIEDDVMELENKAHAHANKTVLDGIAASNVTAWNAKVDSVAADTGLTASRSGNAVTVGIDTTVVFILNGGTSTTVL